MREERVASSFGKMSRGRAWALLCFLLTALRCVRIRNNVFWCASEARRAREEEDSQVGDAEHTCVPSPGPGCAQPLLSTSLWVAARPPCVLLHPPFPGFSGKRSSATWLVVVYPASPFCEYGLMHTYMFSCTWKNDWAKLNLPVLIHSFHGLTAVIFADTVPVAVPVEGQAETWAGGGGSSGEKGTLHDWACHSPCCRADSSHVSSQLEVFHAHGSLPKYQEF